MGFDEGQIILDSDNGAYYAGQTVYGRVVFDQDKVKTIHGIYVDMKGFCKVHWTSQRYRRVNDRSQAYTVNHDSHEEYFRRKTFIFGADSGEHHLQPGHHEFRFDCQIPANCPSSFEGSHGHIRYRIKVVMVTSGMFSMNKDKMIAVRVLAPLDLNHNPYCKEPVEFELLSSYCCWCVSAGSSVVSVKMPVGGYCPGQVIPLEVSCKNTSSVEIDEIKFAIKKAVRFIATLESGTRNEQDTVAEIRKGPVPPNTTRNWTLEMEVPAMDIYNVISCQFIDINYHFKVSTEVDGCHEGAEEIHSIIFGTIPLVGFQDNIQNPLHDQLPKSMEIQNVQGANCYPPPPIISQPVPNSSYPSTNAPYPNVSPYPGNAPYPTTPNLGRNPPYAPGNQPYPNVSPYPPNAYPGGNPPYPGGNPPYPGGNPPYPSGTPPYPGGNPPYPGGNPPYPGGNPPYPGGNPPYPGGNPPYPATNSPYPTGNAPYPVGISPYPPGNAPYPTNTPYSTDSPHGGNSNPVPPYPGAGRDSAPPYPGVFNTTPLKTGTFGFMAPTPPQNDGEGTNIPLLPPEANVPYPTSPPTNPYAASAPVPSTPSIDDNKPPFDGTPETTTNSPPPYNPEFMNEKKDEKR